MAYNVDRYVVERLRDWSGEPHWIGIWDCETLEQAQVELAKSVFKFGGQWRIRDRWNAIKEE